MSTYLLILEAPAARRLRVGASHEVALQPGCYLYVGSARRCLAARLQRHGRTEKKRRWHIDYLLDGQALTIREIWVGPPGEECRLAQALLTLPRVSVPRARLGASDCRCPAHFLRCDQTLPELQHYLRSSQFSLYAPA